ncbi:MAG: PDZ domain-containing protein [Gammaproteobacteria bacterium]
MGVEIRRVDPQDATGRSPLGVVVLSLAPGGAAYTAGIKPQDIILSFNNYEINAEQELVKLVSETQPGTIVPILILRGSQFITLTAKLSEQPAPRGFAREQQKIEVAWLYGALIRALALSTEQQHVFLELLVDKHWGESDTDAQTDPEGGSDSTSTSERAQEIEQRIAALLGEGKLRAYQEYQRTLAARGRVNRIDAHLLGMGFPLSESQSSALITSMVELRETFPAPVELTSNSTVDDLARYIAWMDDSDRRVLEQAGPALMPEQAKYMRAYFERAAAERRKALETQRARWAAGREEPLWYPSGLL